MISSQCTETRSTSSPMTFNSKLSWPFSFRQRISADVIREQPIPTAVLRAEVFWKRMTSRPGVPGRPSFGCSLAAQMDLPSEHVRVIVQNITFLTAEHKAVILREFTTQSFSEKTERIFGLYPAFCDKHQLFAWNSFCRSEEMIPVDLISTVEVIIGYKALSRRGFRSLFPKTLWQWIE